jgi:hypothetical protein
MTRPALCLLVVLHGLTAEAIQDYLREADQLLMILLGQSATGRTTLGLLTSPDGQRWTLLPEGR